MEQRSTRLVLVRHGQTDWNRAGLWQGHADRPLTETGRAQARALAEAHSPDLVLLDLRLPDGSGLELIPHLLAHDAGMQVVLMTAYGSVRDAVEAIRRGAADYLQKPLDLGELSYQ